MDLRKRLAQLDPVSRKDSGASGRSSPSAGLKAEETAARRTAALAELGVAEETTESGPVWVRSYRDDIPCPFGPLPDLAGFFTLPAEPGPRGILFLDTETTGLAGGTGTIPFLVGTSWWADEALRTRQYFLPGPGNETAMLQDLARLASGFQIVATFNGASFDLPLLRTRARLNRLDDPLGGLGGWDLLVPSRRLWGNRLDDCRQQTIEVEVCGLPRGPGDIEGSRIPQTWFDFLASGSAGLLPKVLTHNHRDMLGMARLFLEILNSAKHLETGKRVPAGLTWSEGWALGRICERRRDTSAALACLASAVQVAPARGDRGMGEARFIADALRILKRGGDWKLVEGVIRAGMEAGVDEPWLHREAAILYEHRLVDVRKALDHAVKSGEDIRVARLQRLESRRG